MIARRPDPEQNIRQQILVGAGEMGLEPTPQIADVLEQYLRLLQKWNQTYNLTAVRELPDMVVRHVLDSLCTVPYVRGHSLIDIGSGAGLPGIPLATIEPRRLVTLLDSRSKRARFLRHATSTLALANVTVVNKRAQQFRPRRKFDTLIARAVAPLRDLVSMAGHLCMPGGRVIAMKGSFPDAEIGDLNSSDYELVAVHNVLVPGLAEQRHLVILRRNRGS